MNAYAFLLDASACSGCKACQVACKDKNQLPLGVLWRRVYEVTGGGWKQDGEAWTSTVFAYNLSVACNHCVHPKCAGVCPTDAYSVRDDGIVLLDTSKCMGCGYCAWACPYDAPQYDRAAGHMTKCNFCIDHIEQGLPPACVAACPLRVLDYAKVSDERALAANRVALWEAPAEAHPYPMPGQSRTRPHLAIRPHVGMKSAEEKRVANREEVQPRVTGWEEMPLVVFTLLAQMAVGGVWAMLWLLPDAKLQLLPLLGIGLCLGIGMIASFAHLGTKRNAWRALSHLRKSWLSRELLFTLLFAAGWAASLGLTLLHVEFPPVLWLTALLGVELIHCMSKVYRLHSIPVWDTWRTEARFFLSAALLGTLGMVPVLAWLHVPVPQAAGVLAILLLLAQAVIERNQTLFAATRRLELELILLGMIACAAVFFIPGWLGVFSSAALLLIVLAGQAVGRWSFYRARTEA
jgi:anaerobic dimethyl sulfoxide reductase subunit B (iron-sulfur subunit)